MEDIKTPRMCAGSRRTLKWEDVGNAEKRQEEGGKIMKDTNEREFNSRLCLKPTRVDK